MRTRARVCVCVCVFPFIQGFSLLNKTNVMPEVQVCDGVQKLYLCQVPFSPRHRQSLQEPSS